MTASGQAKPTGAGAVIGPRLREFVTPEGVDLRLRIGEAGERAAGFILDMVFLIIANILFRIGAALVILSLGFVGSEAAQAATAVALLMLFVLTNGYFVIFELGPRAATPGKRIMGLRVAARDGGRLTSEAVFARNAMRNIEVFLPLEFILASAVGAVDPIAGWLVMLGLVWTGVFALFPLFNRDRLRVGDLVAGTWVVKSPRERLSIDLLDAQGASRDPRFDFTQDQASAYGVKELHVLEDVLRRKDRKTMEAVAQRIRAKIGWTQAADETVEAFLSAYYGALRGRLETRLLFGHRRKDKFDKA